MTQYRKKPVVIDAWQWDGRNEEGAPAWFVEGRKNVFTGKLGSILRDFDRLSILTLEGMLHASAGDWIIRGIKGEIYACKPDIFALTYEDAGAESMPDMIAKVAVGNLKTMTEERETLRGRMRALFLHMVPQCTAFDEPEGILSQIDNAICGLRMEKEAAEAEVARLRRLIEGNEKGRTEGSGI